MRLSPLPPTVRRPGQWWPPRRVTQTSLGMDCLRSLSTSRQGCPLPQAASAGREKGRISRRLHPHLNSIASFYPGEPCERFTLGAEEAEIRDRPSSLTAHHMVGERDTHIKKPSGLYEDKTCVRWKPAAQVRGSVLPLTGFVFGVS